MELTGKIKRIGQTNTFGDNGFRKRNLVITTDEKYPQTILLEFHQDKTSLLDNYSDGQDVKVSINVRGREWTNPEGKIVYFNTLVGWRIESVSSSSQDTPQPEQPQQSNNSTASSDDDLPF